MVFLLAAVRPAMASEPLPNPDAGVFTAGEIKVTGKKEDAGSTVTSDTIEKFGRTDITRAVDLLPGVSFGNVGARNEGMIYVRGFDMRQVPLYLDGVPQYVPYDGYVDPNRFTTFELSEITVSKGYASVLYGPNTLGGAINLVTRKPEKSLEGTARAGFATGHEGVSGGFGSLNLGSNLRKWYVQTSLSDLSRDFWPMSGQFRPTTYENGGKRDNSATRDLSGGIKIGYTPNSTDEYTISYNGISSSKGVPLYTGSNPLNTAKFWKYTDWDKSSLYYIGKTALGTKSYLKTKAYFDGYYNVLDSYDDASFTTQKNKSSFTSVYDDKIFGASVELGTEIMHDDTVKFAMIEKHDQHREYNVGVAPKVDEENTVSVAAENSWAASKSLRMIAGVRQDFQNTLKAEDYTYTDAKRTVISGVGSFPLENNQATNFQLSVEGKINDRQTLTGYVARTTRFATLKDRYSYKFGTFIPNPDLNPEQSWNYGMDYSVRPVDNLELHASVYQSKLSDAIQEVTNVANVWVWDSKKSAYVLNSASQYQNTGKATFTGFELFADWRPYKWLKTTGGYSYIERKNDSKPTILFTDVPKNKLNGSVQFLHDRRTWALVEAEYSSKRYSTSDGKYTAGGYGLVNLRGSVGLNRALSLQASVGNLFDRNYQVAEGYPEPGRSYEVSLAYAF